jgi:hypothetical protein
MYGTTNIKLSIILLMIMIIIISITVTKSVGLGTQNLFLESQHVLRLSFAIFFALCLLSDPKEILFVLRLSVTILSKRRLFVALVCLYIFNVLIMVLWYQDSLGSLIVWIVWVILYRNAMTLDTTQQSQLSFLNCTTELPHATTRIVFSMYNTTAQPSHNTHSYTSIFCAQFNSLMLLNLLAVFLLPQTLHAHKCIRVVVFCVWIPRCFAA